MTGEQAAPRTYGGWRRRRPMGLLGLGPAGTLALLGAIVAVLATVTLSPRAALYVAPPVLAGAALSLARIQGMPLAPAAPPPGRPGGRCGRGGRGPWPGPGGPRGPGRPSAGSVGGGPRPVTGRATGPG